MTPRSEIDPSFAPVRRALVLTGWSLTFLITLAGAVVRFRIAPVPLADPDTWGYISPAISLFNGHGFQQASGRDWLYPAMVWLGLKTTGSFGALALIQQTLGVFSGVLFWLVLRAWMALLPACAISEACMAVLGPIAMALYLLNPRTIYFELSLRPESVFCFFGFAQLSCVTHYIRARWRDGGAGEAFASGLATCVLAYVCVLLKPSWAFGAAFTVLPVVAGVFGTGIARWARWGTVPAAMAVSLFFLWLPAKLTYVHDAASGTFLSATLFTIHAREILAEMERREAALPDGDSRKAFLQDFLPVFQAEFAKAVASPGVYRRLGYDADYLMYQSPLLASVMTQQHLSQQQLATFCRRWYLQALLGDPAAMAGKIGRQLGYFFTGDSTVFFGRSQLLDWDYGVAAASLPAVPDSSSLRVAQIYGSYLADVKSATSSHVSLYGPAWIHDACGKVFANVWLMDSVFLLFLVISLLWRDGRGLRLAGIAAAILFSAPLGNALTVSIIHALDMNRYRYTYSGFLLLAFAAMAVFCLSVAARLAARQLRGSRP